MCLIDGSDTIELHPMENAFYAVANRDTVVSIFFSKYHIDGFIMLDSSHVKIQVNDSSILISANDSVGGNDFHAGVYYTDTTFLIIEDSDTLAQASITENELCINLPDEALDCPIISGNIYINLENKVETLFCTTDKCILRKLNNSYYLNRLRGKNDSCYWRVSQLTLDNDVLSFSKIYPFGPYNALDKLKEVTGVTEVKKDSDSYYIVDPSKREFKKFVKLDGFTEESLRYKKWK